MRGGPRNRSRVIAFRHASAPFTSPVDVVHITPFVRIDPPRRSPRRNAASSCRMSDYSPDMDCWEVMYISDELGEGLYTPGEMLPLCYDLL